MLSTYVPDSMERERDRVEEMDWDKQNLTEEQRDDKLQ